MLTSCIRVRVLLHSAWQALQVLTVEFGNTTLGSQTSKHAEAFSQGKKVVAITDIAGIVLEEVRGQTVSCESL